MSPRSPLIQRSILLWVFMVNVVVFGVAVLALAFSPATIHSPIRTDELLVVLAGLLVTLLVDFALLSLVLSPVRRLAELMGDVDPMHPGQRAVLRHSRWMSVEVGVLACALNTMLDRVETERRESARRALAAQEEERGRIARELHDEVGQTLTAVALQVERAASERSARPSTLHEITTVIHRSLDDVRRIARELRPEALEDLGLTGALVAMCLRIERTGTVRITRELQGDLPELPSEIELVIYRVAQEALTNALRHSGASRVRLALLQQQGRVLLTVEDDGCGLREAQGRGDGLAGMRERALLIQGELLVGRSHAGGVKIALDVPIGVLQT